MRVAVVADTHMPRGGRRLPDRCLSELARADLALHAGDVVTAAVLEDLNRLAPIGAVAGNMDEPALRVALPETRVVEVGGARIGMIHDAGPADGRRERLRQRFSGCQAVVYGHTHVPELSMEDGIWILNPGSPTERRRAPTRAMLVLTVGGGRIVPEILPSGLDTNACSLYTTEHMFARLLLVTLTLVILWALVARASSGSGREHVYRVKPYDTLWSIAESRYGGDPREAVWRIRERNHLDGTLLRPGQRLVLPP